MIHLLFNLMALIHSCCQLGIQNSMAGRPAGLGKASLHQQEFSPCAFESHYHRSKVVRGNKAQSQSERQVPRGTETCCLNDGKWSVSRLSPGSRICSPSSWHCVASYKEEISCCAAANSRELHEHFQKKQMLCGKKLDLDPLNHFPESSATVLLFSVTMYGDTREITDVNMGTMPVPCRVPSLGSTPGERERPGQGPAKLQQQRAAKGVRKRTEAAQREEEGKGAKKSCYNLT